MSERIATDAEMNQWHRALSRGARFDRPEDAVEVALAFIARCRAADALHKSPSEDSVVLDSDEPGCFYCNSSEEHREDCEFAAYRRAVAGESDGE